MGKSAKILKAKKMGDKQTVQKLQQDMGVVNYTCEEKDNSYTALTDLESTDLYNNMPQKTTTIEDIVAYIK